MVVEVWVHLFQNFIFIQFVGVLCIWFSEELILSCNVLTNLCCLVIWKSEIWHGRTPLIKCWNEQSPGLSPEERSELLDINIISINWTSLCKAVLQLKIHLQSDNQAYVPTSWPEEYLRILTSKLSLTGIVLREPM